MEIHQFILPGYTTAWKLNKIFKKKPKSIKHKKNQIPKLFFQIIFIFISIFFFSKNVKYFSCITNTATNQNKSKLWVDNFYHVISIYFPNTAKIII